MKKLDLLVLKKKSLMLILIKVENCLPITIRCSSIFNAWY